ncbi:MAG: hypothetical protein U9Q07_03890 [Planctomycetota bacterium]|nr:hypothetical protein [Planctomycetota bacterium]
MSEFYDDKWTLEDWKIEIDERVGIKMDSGIEESEAMRQTKAELKGRYEQWKEDVGAKRR